MKRRRAPDRVWIGLLLLLVALPAAAEKTDVLVMKNGDKVTGEIDHLEGGLLIYKTDNMGTLNVEWEDISELTSKTTFRVELKSGDIHYGSLVTPPHGESLQVAEMSGNILVPMMDVAFIDPIHKQFWKRFDVAVDAGFSYTQANSATQLSASGQVVYQVENARAAFSFNSLIIDQESVDASARQDVSLSYLRSLPHYKRNWWFLLGELQSNEELGLELRVLGAGGLGELFVQTYRSDFLVAVGIAVSEEYAASSSDKFTSTELLGHVDYTYSTHDYPKTQVSFMGNVHPSLSDWWRIRVELNAAVKRELFHDFYIKLSPFESFDSDPREEGAAESDWGITTSLGWSY
jgi:hypothetical protein